VSAKTSSTPPDFARGFLTALGDLAAALGVPAGRMLAETSYIVHGTTSTLNSIVTGDVAPVGFLTTRGHADSIAIMNLEGRYAGLSPDQVQHMARTNKPAPLVPRHRIIEIDERVDYKGEVIVRLDEDGVRQAVSRLLDNGVEAIAVSLLWSFRNPAHERRIRELIHEQAPGLYVALSSDVSPRIREYARGAWMKSASWGLNEVTADRVQLVGADGEVLAGSGPRHSEYPIHTEIMNARPDVGGVVHTHPPHAVALAATGQPLRPVSHAANFFIPPGIPRFTQTADLVLTRELGKAVAAELAAAPAIFLVNHGIVTVGRDLQAATVAAVLLERACASRCSRTRSAAGRPGPDLRSPCPSGATSMPRARSGPYGTTWPGHLPDGGPSSASRRRAAAARVATREGSWCGS
jgi:ribulose-5-phosphate 4-epimerase/fuculose-1-phosphate aldolase